LDFGFWILDLEQKSKIQNPKSKIQNGEANQGASAQAGTTAHLRGLQDHRA
jgi:hypothetical protein